MVKYWLAMGDEFWRPEIGREQLYNRPIVWQGSQSSIELIVNDEVTKGMLLWQSDGRAVAIVLNTGRQNNQRYDK
jgi:hypothetical protein